MGKLAYMINHNQIELHQFFTMHPFSMSQKKIYDAALEGIDFFNELYIKNNKTYERLATICNVINNVEKNLIVITGYRGCGKTNFLRLIKYLSDGGKGIETLEELKKYELDHVKNSDDIKNLIQKGYTDSIDKIRNTFFGEMYGEEDEVIGRTFIDYVTEQLSGKCKYINFDEGGMGREKPFSTKLFYIIRGSIYQHKREGRLSDILDVINSFAIRNRWIIEENFEEIDFPALKYFWINVKEKLYNIDNDSSYDGVLDELKRLSLEQLLFVYTIWEFAEIITAGREEKDRKLIYLLDNIDIISDGKTNILGNTMMGIWKFIWDIGNVFAKIREEHNEKDNGFITLYDKMNIIVAMRETTAMHITGHLRDKMRAIMEHFDMSADVDKTEIMHRKIDLALSLIEKKEICSKGFIEAINCLEQLINDRLFMRTLFQLFNNDYRTSIMCISTICIEHMESVKKAIRLMNSNNASLVFGGRGIIYRLIIDDFFEWNYFDAIGVPSIKSKRRTLQLPKGQEYSCARIILTILCNKQAKIPERFFVNPEESVRLADLYGMVEKLMEIDEFVNIIDGMYSLRNKRFWNHLVTFDNIISYTPHTIKKFIAKDNAEIDENDIEEDIYIRATSAGQVFADIICIHFEYFASRYASTTENVSLFLLDNLQDKKQLASMKKIVSDVYEAVEKCTVALEKYNRNVMTARNVAHYEDLLDSPYYYERQFHEERIIHNQISYLEAYRTYLFTLNIEKNRLYEINRFLLLMIQKYLDLLKYDLNNGVKQYRDEFLSNNSKNLYNELNVCIEEIVKSEELEDRIMITRDYYMANYKEKVCGFLKRRNR